jgi:hypothetical protein
MIGHDRVGVLLIRRLLIPDALLFRSVISRSSVDDNALPYADSICRIPDGGDENKFALLITTGNWIMTTLVACDNISFFSKNIYNLPLAFIAPLRTDYN